MQTKFSINLESNIIDEIVFSLSEVNKKKFLNELKARLRSKGIKITQTSNISTLVEEHFTLKEVRVILRDMFKLLDIESEETRKLKAFYLEQRINRLSVNNLEVRNRIFEALKTKLEKNEIFNDPGPEKWNGLSEKERHDLIIYHAANHLSYLELEDIFNGIFSPDAHLPEIVKKVRNVDAIKSMSNSEIVPFLQELVEHERRIPETDKKEALESIIETFISDHHYYKVSALKYFSFNDVLDILKCRICLPDRQGKIGQKAAGMILAFKICITESSEYARHIRIPESYFLTSDVFFECTSYQRYNFSSLKRQLKEGTITELELEEEYPRIKELILGTEMPDSIRIELRELLKKLGHHPLITRSSSLLEDSASAFSGKYDSFFFANQRCSENEEEDLEQRLDILIKKILMIYASVLKPEAIIYRRERGLLDVDERMSILIQTVEGESYRKYYYPTLAGVGLSHNNRVNTRKINWDDPVLRIGMGLGTGVVDIKGYQVKVVYPDFPDYSPVVNYFDILKTSQRQFDVLNLETDTVDSISKEVLFEYFNRNREKSDKIQDVVRTLGRFFLSTAHQDYLTEGIGLSTKLDTTNHIVTMEGLKKTKFYEMTSWILRTLAEKYNPADIEFTVKFFQGKRKSDIKKGLDFTFTFVQCRQLTGMQDVDIHNIPTNLQNEDILFRVSEGVVNGYAANIEYVVYVDAEKYFKLDETKMYTVARLIGQINHLISDRKFVLIGPGRWGSNLPYYGIKSTYTEIYHTQALIEVSRKLSDDKYTEPSVGSHFGNDVRESNIITLSINPGMEGTIFDEKTFLDKPNELHEILGGMPLENWVSDVIRLIDAKSFNTRSRSNNQFLHIISNVEEQVAVMFLGEKRAVRKFHSINPRRPIEESAGGQDQ